MKFAFVEAHRHRYPVARLCQTLDVSVSGYYCWRKRQRQLQPTRRQQANEQLSQAIRTIHQASHATYGSPRIHAQLRAEGWVCSKQRVERLMRQQCIRGKCKRQRRPLTTLSQHILPVVPNLLNQEFRATRPNEKWASDITYIPTAQGWLYLAVVLDLYSRKVVGWAMDTTMTTELVKRALQAALATRQTPMGLLHHSDRGSQYASFPYGELLAQHHMRPSMSRTGNCYDNAVVESFFATLKVECLHNQPFASPAQARQEIFRYIEGFYNRSRLHSSLGFLSPVQFEDRFAH
jgi:transposase InsO family protein